MPQVTYPSRVVPGPPPLRMELPDGWEQVWVPETLVAIVEKDTGAGHFLANVTVRFFQRVGAFTGPDAVDELRGWLADKADPQFEGDKGVEVDGRMWHGAHLAFRDPNAGTIGQVHFFTTAAENDVVDVLHFTGSCGGDRAQEDMPTIRRILESIRLETGAGA